LSASVSFIGVFGKVSLAGLPYGKKSSEGSEGQVDPKSPQVERDDQQKDIVNKVEGKMDSEEFFGAYFFLDFVSKKTQRAIGKHRHE